MLDLDSSDNLLTKWLYDNTSGLNKTYYKFLSFFQLIKTLFFQWKVLWFSWDFYTENINVLVTPIHFLRENIFTEWNACKTI